MRLITTTSATEFLKQTEAKTKAVNAVIDEVETVMAKLETLAPHLGPITSPALTQMRDLADGSVQTHPTWISPQVRANRENAKLSKGPVTAEGKAISKLNATRHGLTGRQVLLPSEDADAYTAHIERFRRDLQPATERELTQMLADTQWRINRIPNLESAIFAVGRMRYAELHKDYDPAIRDRVIDFYTMEQHSRQLNNLSIQESRLRRNYAKDLAELNALQAERRENETAAQAANHVSTTVAATAGSATIENGFVFTNAHSAVSNGSSTAKTNEDNTSDPLLPRRSAEQEARPVASESR